MLNLTERSVLALNTVTCSPAPSLTPPAARSQVGAASGAPSVTPTPRFVCGSERVRTFSAVTGTPLSERTMMLWSTPSGMRSGCRLGDLQVRFVEVDDRVAVRGHRRLEGLRHAVGVGVVEADLHLDLRHLVGGVEHHDLLGGALLERRPSGNTHTSAGTGAPSPSVMPSRAGLVPSKVWIRSTTTRPLPDLHLRRHLALRVTSWSTYAPTTLRPGTTKFWKRSVCRVPSSVAKSIVTVASSGNGFMNTRSSRAPRSVTPHGNDHDGAAVELHGAVAATAALRQRGDLVLDGDLAPFDLDDGRGERAPSRSPAGSPRRGSGRAPPPGRGREAGAGAVVVVVSGGAVVVVVVVAGVVSATDGGGAKRP